MPKVSTFLCCRVFLVTRVERASGGFRPNFLFNGELVEVLPGVSGEAHRLERVLNTNELQLSLRYEPPSPKFTKLVHGQEMVSYRLKLLDGHQFIYLQRGLPKVLVVDEHVRAVGWGQLQLVFHTEQQLASFLKVLRCGRLPCHCCSRRSSL
ncbi:hypothetical protein DUNSADRAFT_5902 [Dunaliella salina]|uniref:Encoded protein n=1 Tax=Dunaliella salina TaxID=3046 RepID=A0ABQ7GPD7_DUNSA|nr:hypothetical protein DUNSADRAFT_5902 [Dunaliella salina]|eukprot:KAF5836455.1 hypothetical protein DUNSADRAFT_5902 [Dunaliella salina]